MKNTPLTISKVLGTTQTAHAQFHSETCLKKNSTHNHMPHYATYIKAYDRFPAFTFGKRAIPTSLKKVLDARSSQRSTGAHTPLDSATIGSLITYAVGIKKNKPKPQTRYYPSAGARYPLEIYVIPNHVTGLTRRSVYHYNVRGDYFEVRSVAATDRLDQCFQQKFVAQSDAVIVITGIFKRTTMKYGERGYRYALIESGHVGQNLYLLAAAMGIQICGICGFFDSNLNSYLHLDMRDETALYAFAVNA